MTPTRWIQRAETTMVRVNRRALWWKAGLRFFFAASSLSLYSMFPSFRGVSSRPLIVFISRKEALSLSRPRITWYRIILVFDRLVSFLPFSFSDSTRLPRISPLSWRMAVPLLEENKEWIPKERENKQQFQPRLVFIGVKLSIRAPDNSSRDRANSAQYAFTLDIRSSLPFTPPYGFRNTSGCPVHNRLHINARTSPACKVFRYYAVQQCSQLRQFRNMPREIAAGLSFIVSPTRFLHVAQLNSSFVIRQSIRRDWFLGRFVPLNAHLSR